MYKDIYLLMMLLTSISACTAAKKIECAAAFVGCGTLCTCDLPACECCIACLACITATSADCCECVFPTWEKCSGLRSCGKALYDPEVASCCDESISIICPSAECCISTKEIFCCNINNPCYTQGECYRWPKELKSLNQYTYNNKTYIKSIDGRKK